jgi:hypothetical protein
LEAGVAQLVEQLIRNQQVIGSSPIAGSKFLNIYGPRGSIGDTEVLPFFASSYTRTPSEQLHSENLGS